MSETQTDNSLEATEGEGHNPNRGPRFLQAGSLRSPPHWEALPRAGEGRRAVPGTAWDPLHRGRRGQTVLRHTAQSWPHHGR